MALTSGSGRQIVLGPRLAGGGQGEILAVVGHPKVVCKRIFEKALAADQTLANRLALMVSSPPARWREVKSGHVLLSWPLDVVHDNGRFVGFLMPMIDVGKTVELHDIANPSSRRETSQSRSWKQGFSWEYLVATAANLALAVDTLHDAGVVIGDFNERNILVWKDARVTLLDCDSMQISDPLQTQRFLCGVGRPEFTAPELINANWHSTVRFPSSDLFALAIHFHQLLLEGAHPFDGVWHGSGDKPMRHLLAHDGLWVYGGDSRLTPRPSAVALDLLSPGVKGLFQRALVDGARNPRNRPSAWEWHQELIQLQLKLLVCNKNSDHVYRSSLRTCPWCEREASRRVQTPLPPAVGQPTAVIPPPPVIVTFTPAPTTAAAPTSPPPPPPPPVAAGRQASRLNASDLGWALVAVTLVLILGGFAAGVFLEGSTIDDADLLGRLAFNRVAAHVIALAALCGLVAYFATGRRRAYVASAALGIGSLAIGGGWLDNLVLPAFLHPDLTNPLSEPIVTFSAAAAERLPAIASGCAVAAGVLVACLHRMLASQDQSRSASRAPLYAAVPLAVLAIAGGGAASYSTVANGGDGTGGVAVGNVWIAQLASVGQGEGQTALDAALAAVRSQVPGARVLSTDDFGSYDAGYWVVYYEGDFARGRDVIRFCDSHGRTTRNECIGHYLTREAPDRTPVCLRNDDGSLSEDC